MAERVGWSSSDDPEIISLAQAVHSKLPHIPVMGVDIVRDHATGQPVVMEMNSGGWTWHLSSEHGRNNQRTHGLDYYAQNNALEVIADALADVTRREAL